VTKPNPENCKNCSSKCAYDCAQLQYTIQHRTVPIISPLTSKHHSSDAVYWRGVGGKPSIGILWLHLKVHFRTMLSVNLTSKPVTLEMSSCHVDLIMSNCDRYVMSLIKIHPCIPKTDEKMPSKVLIWPRGLPVTLTFDLLTSKSKHFISVPSCTKGVNLVQFPQVV